MPVKCDAEAFLAHIYFCNPFVIPRQCHCFKDLYINFSRDLETLAARVDEKVEFYAVSCVPLHDICRALGVNTYPTTQLYQAGSIHGIKITQSELQPLRVLEMLGVQIDSLSEATKEQMDRDVEDRGSFPFLVLCLWVMAVCFVVCVLREKSQIARSRHHEKLC